jgi:dephospho-CoA kinase
VLLVALTGGIASGKSLVARMLADLGAYLIDSDQLSRKVVEPHKPAWRDIVDCFGPEILLPDQSVDRKALARIVFGDQRRRKKLEDIVHPRIWEEQKAITEEIIKRDPSAIIVRDVPLLFEAHLEGQFARIILVYVPASVQLARLMERDGLNREEAQSRLDAQMPIEAKLPLAHYVIHNEGTIEDTRAQVEKVFAELRGLERSGGA